MEKSKNITSVERREETLLSRVRDAHSENMDLAHIQKLVHLLDRSDIAEIELNRADMGLHLVLRKIKAPECSRQVSEIQSMDMSKHIAPSDKLDHPTPAPPIHCLKAHTVGIFHPWLKPHGKMLIAVGDLVKAGQIVGTIEVLAILNEVETNVAGRVIEILVQDGQSVEYGQDLVTIESSATKL